MATRVTRSKKKPERSAMEESSPEPPLQGFTREERGDGPRLQGQRHITMDQLQQILNERDEQLETRLSRNLATQVTDRILDHMERMQETFQASLNRLDSRMRAMERPNIASNNNVRNEERIEAPRNMNIVDERIEAPRNMNTVNEREEVNRDNTNVRDDDSVEVEPANKNMNLQNITFNGKDSWSEYYAQFLAIADMSKWSEKTKTITLLNSLRGTALTILVGIPENDRIDFKKLCKALERRFESKNRK